MHPFSKLSRSPKMN